MKKHRFPLAAALYLAAHTASAQVLVPQVQMPVGGGAAPSVAGPQAGGTDLSPGPGLSCSGPAGLSLKGVLSGLSLPAPQAGLQTSRAAAPADPAAAPTRTPDSPAPSGTPARRESQDTSPAPRPAATAVAPAVAAAEGAPAVAAAGEVPEISAAGPVRGAERPAKSEEQPFPRPSRKRLLLAPEGEPRVGRLLKMLAALGRSWGSPYTPDEVHAAQREAAEAVGLRLEKGSGVPEISPSGDHWLNRWTRRLRRGTGVRVLWSPLGNHNNGFGASYSPAGGYVLTDDLAPVLRAPTPEFRHEFLHALFDRGGLRREFKPLGINFHKGWWGSFPAADAHPEAAYARYPSFVAQELPANLHSVYARATEVQAFLEETAGAGGTADKDGPDIKALLSTVDSPVFLARSIHAMASGLMGWAALAAQAGLAGAEMRKDYGWPDHRSLRYAGQLEDNKRKDSAFFHAERGEGADKVNVKFMSLARLHEEDPDSDEFPVFFGNSRYSASVSLSFEKISKLELDDPKTQELVVQAAARALVRDMLPLMRLTAMLMPDIDRLEDLYRRAQERVDLGLIRDVKETARAAFTRAMRFFTKASPRGRDEKKEGRPRGAPPSSNGRAS